MDTKLLRRVTIIAVLIVVLLSFAAYKISHVRAFVQPTNIEQK